MTNKIGVAVLGATGAVGQRFVERLQSHPLFDIRMLIASERNIGKRYRDACTWHQDRPLGSVAGNLPLQHMDDLQNQDHVRVVFSALPGDMAGHIEARLADAGFAVFTNASNHRMDPDVPLLIPEVNPDHMALAQLRERPGFVVANGNCSAIILTLALAPIHRHLGIEEVDVTTLQGLSGAGYPGVSSLDIIDNVVPYIGGEEEKLEEEPAKMLGTFDGQEVRYADIHVRATATRVPVREGHLESVHAKVHKATDAEELASIWRGFRGPPAVQNLPTAPRQPIHVVSEDNRPQPRRDRDAEGGMAVTVGRIRVDPDGHHVRFVVLGHNTIRGAAGQSILNAEYAHAQGLLDRQL